MNFLFFHFVTLSEKKDCENKILRFKTCYNILMNQSIFNLILMYHFQIICFSLKKILLYAALTALNHSIIT